VRLPRSQRVFFSVVSLRWNILCAPWLSLSLFFWSGKRILFKHQTLLSRSQKKRRLLLLFVQPGASFKELFRSIGVDVSFHRSSFFLRVLILERLLVCVNLSKRASFAHRFLSAKTSGAVCYTVHRRVLVNLSIYNLYFANFNLVKVNNKIQFEHRGTAVQTVGLILSPGVCLR